MSTTTSNQRKQLYKLFRYNKETEALHVKQATQDENKTTAADLSLTQASMLIKSLTTHWARFNTGNQQHMYILSLLKQIGWTKSNEKYGIVADMDRLSTFLKSNKSPVPKPLQSMQPKEVSKLISCLESMIGKAYSK